MRNTSNPGNFLPKNDIKKKPQKQFKKRQYNRNEKKKGRTIGKKWAT